MPYLTPANSYDDIEYMDYTDNAKEKELNEHSVCKESLHTANDEKRLNISTSAKRLNF